MITTTLQGGKVAIRHRVNGEREVIETGFADRPYYFVKSSDSYLCDAHAKKRGYTGIYGE